MELKEQINKDKQEKNFLFSKGILYFNKRTERLVFFILTIIMLSLGLLVKLGMF